MIPAEYQKNLRKLRFPDDIESAFARDYFERHRTMARISVWVFALVAALLVGFSVEARLYALALVPFVALLSNGLLLWQLHRRDYVRQWQPLSIGALLLSLGALLCFFHFRFQTPEAAAIAAGLGICITLASMSARGFLRLQRRWILPLHLAILMISVGWITLAKDSNAFSSSTAKNTPAPANVDTNALETKAKNGDISAAIELGRAHRKADEAASANAASANAASANAASANAASANAASANAASANAASANAASANAASANAASANAASANAASANAASANAASANAASANANSATANVAADGFAAGFNDALNGDSDPATAFELGKKFGRDKAQSAKDKPPFDENSRPARLGRDAAARDRADKKNGTTALANVIGILALMGPLFALEWFLAGRNERNQRREFLEVFLLERERDEEKGKREQTEAMLHVLSQAIGGIVHDLGNPLTSVQTGAETLKYFVEDGEADAATVMEFSEIILSGAQMLNYLRLSLMEQTRVLENRPIPVSLAPTSLKRIAETGALYQMPKFIAGRHVEMPAEDIEMLADEMKLVTVFMNLIGNALKYSDGPIRVGWTTHDDTLLVGVIDRGKAGRGISREQAQKLFVPFGRLETHNNIEGTGLGLLSVRAIALAHEGAIYIEGHEDGTPNSAPFSTAETARPTLLSEGDFTAFVLACPLCPPDEPQSPHDAPAQIEAVAHSSHA